MLGVPVLAGETDNPLTIGRRLDTRGLTDALVRRAGDVLLGSGGDAIDGPLVLATGGFQGDPALVADDVRNAQPIIGKNPRSPRRLALAVFLMAAPSLDGTLVAPDRK